MLYLLVLGFSIIINPIPNIINANEIEIELWNNLSNTSSNLIDIIAAGIHANIIFNHKNTISKSTRIFPILNSLVLSIGFISSNLFLFLLFI